MIAVPSFSREEEAVATLFGAHLDSLAIPHQRQGNNIWCIAPGYDAHHPTILLNGHLDTVRPVSGWTYDPFTPTEADGKLYGLGSNDDGGGVVSLLQTFRLLSGRHQPYNLVFLASCEEEVSGRNGIESVLSLLPPIDFAVVGEPTSMQPAIAEKGLMVIDAVAHGKAGHAARNEGVNAIYKALRDIQWIEGHTFEKQTDLLGPVKATVTIIQAGTQHNVIPDQCTFTIDVRSNECYTNQEIFDALAHQLDSELKARSFRLNSSMLPASHPFIRKAVETGHIINKEITPFGSPTLSDQALMPFPSVKIGPGDSSRSHTANEYIKPIEIEEAILFYVSVLDGLRLD